MQRCWFNMTARESERERERERDRERERERERSKDRVRERVRMRVSKKRHVWSAWEEGGSLPTFVYGP